MHEEAFETLGDPDDAAPLVFTCEHASNRLPEWTATPADRDLLDDHWGWDVGAADVARALQRRHGGVAVLSRFSRLVCDPNRDTADPTFVVERIDGRTLSWNQSVDDAERRRRHDRYSGPYHDAIDRILGRRRDAGLPTRLCSVHSFTPVWRDAARDVELGVLFDAHEGTAEQMLDGLRAEGFEARANEPYSGYAGLIHAARRHGRAHDVVYLEIEIRQDLIDTPERARAVAERMRPAIDAYARAAFEGRGLRS